MELDPLVLSRVQFALNISFHILFPTITIGLCWILLFFRFQYSRTKDTAWEYAYYFWVKVFALTFALGVVSGITMSFQFGTNWPGFMNKAGNVAGPLLGYEVLTAFFLEASFLAIMLYGKNRVSNRTHLLSTLIVALGTTTSAFWILSLNSWMHTPTGFQLIDGVIHVENWFEVIFNPSFPYRFAHMLTASLLTSAFLIAGVSAWRIRKNLSGPATTKVLHTGVVIAAVLAPLQIILGDLHGLNTTEHQPAKIAAIEAIWETEKGAPLTLFGFPDETEKTTHAALKVPQLGSLILTHSRTGEVKGLEEFSGNHPPVAAVFWAFRIMVGVGMLMLLVAWFGIFHLWKRKKIEGLPLQALSAMTFSGWVAVLAGWYVTEIGRQPWIVYGVIKTSETVAQHAGELVLLSLIGYAIVYSGLLVAYIGALRFMASKEARSLTALQEKQMSEQFKGVQ